MSMDGCPTELTKHISLLHSYRLLSQHPMVNDDLPNRIISGTIKVKPNVREFRGSSVVFEDGTIEDDIDLVVFATGYTFSFPFLQSHVVSVTENKAQLYKYVFPPCLEKSTLAIIGLIQPLGAIMPISEMQARWATRVFKGKQVSRFKVTCLHVFWALTCRAFTFL